MAAATLTDADFAEDVAPQGLTDADFEAQPLTDADFADAPATVAPLSTAAVQDEPTSSRLGNMARAALGGAAGGVADIVGGAAGLLASSGRIEKADIAKYEKREAELAALPSLSDSFSKEQLQQMTVTPPGYRTPQQDADLEFTRYQLKTERAKAASGAGVQTGLEDLQALSSAAAKESQTFFGQDPARQDEFLTKLATGAGSLPPYIASAMAGGPVLSMLIGSLQSGQSEYNAAIESGRPDLADAAMEKGLFIGMTEGVGVGGGMSPAAGAFGKKAVAALFASFKEGGQEWVQTTLSNLNASTATGYDPSRPATKGSGEAFAIGALLGGGVQGVNQAVAKPPLVAELEATGNPLTAEALSKTEVAPTPSPVKAGEASPESTGEPPVVPAKAEPVVKPASTTSAANSHAERTARLQEEGRRATPEERTQAQADRESFRQEVSEGDTIAVEKDGVDSNGNKVTETVRYKVESENGRLVATPERGPSSGLEPDSGSHFFNEVGAQVQGGQVVRRRVTVEKKPAKPAPAAPKAESPAPQTDAAATIADTPWRGGEPASLVAELEATGNPLSAEALAKTVEVAPIQEVVSPEAKSGEAVPAVEAEPVAEPVPEKPVSVAYVDRTGRDSTLEATPADALDMLRAVESEGGEVHAVNGRIVGQRTAEQLIQEATAKPTSAPAAPVNAPEPPQQAAPLPRAEPFREVTLDDGRTIRVLGTGPNTQWADPTVTAGPGAGGRYNLASPSFRKQIEAAEATTPPKPAPALLPEQAEVAGAKETTQGGIAAGGPLLPNTAPSTPVVPIKAMSQIIRDIAKGIDVPIRFGRLTTTKFAGYFKKVQNLIGAKNANDMSIVSHETGHKLDDAFGISKMPALRAELNVLGDPATPGSRSSWTKSKSLKYKHGEGVAEFVRHWLTDPAKAAKDAPLTNKYFEAVMDANPDFGDVMRTAREDVQNWRNAPAEARLDSSISVGDNPNGTRYRLSQLTRDLVDDLHMLKLAVDEATKLSGETPRPSDNPYLLSRLLRGSYGMADSFIRNGVADFKTRGVKLGTSFEDAVKPVSGRINEFRRWVVAKRAQELHAQGKETGLVRTDVNTVAAKYDSDPVFQKAFEDVKKWNDALLQYAVDSGYVSKESAAAMRAMNQDYVPFHRIFEIGAGESPSQTSSGTGRGLNTGKAGSLKRLTGSARDIVDPLETMVKNAYVFITASEKASINRAIGEMANQPGMGKWVEEIAAPKEAVKVELEKVRKELESAGADLSAVPDDLVMQFFQNSGRAPFGENVIKVTNAGVTKFYRLKSELYDAFNALDLDDSSRLIQVLSQPAQVLRAGVTLDPAFGLANVMRDAIGSAVINRYGMLPFEASARGVAALFKNPKLVAEWAASGGEQSFEASFFDRKKMAKFMRERITKDLTPAEQALVVLKSPLTALRFVSGMAESATRIGEFERAYQEAVKSGMPEGEARRQASFESRDRQDFAKGGAKTKILRHMAAFWNAGLQGNIAVAKAFKERPARSTLQGLAYVTLPTMALMAMNWEDKDYWDRPQWERDAFWLMPIGKDANSRTSFLRIPKPFIIGVMFGAVPERLARFAMKNDPKAFKDLMTSVSQQVIPNPMPQVAQVIVSDALTGKQGWDMWRDRPVVPDSLAELPAELQWTEQTSLTAKKIGGALGFSPMKVEHIIAGTTGGLGRQVVHNAIDRVIGAATGETPTATNVVPGARFFTTPAGISSQAVEEFYDKLTKLREQKAAEKVTGNTMKDKAERLRMERDADKISVIRKKIKGTNDATEKQRLYLQISEIAGNPR